MVVKRVATWLPILLVTAVASADGPTLHEYVPDLNVDEGTLLVTSAGAQPAAIVYQGEVLPAPEGGARDANETAMRAFPDSGPGRGGPSFRPDRVTSLEGRVGYQAVFTPGITPFKRVTAFDKVTLASDGTPVLVIGSTERRRHEPVGADASAVDGRTRDRFWGSVVLDVSAGRTIPFPAVAPEARVLTMRSEPPTALRLEQDGADNFYATVVGEPAASEIRVVFLTDAPRDHFGAPLPTGVPADALADRVHELPPSVKRDADAFAAELGLSPKTDFARALTTLVAHFRSFEESATPPRDTGNIYLDLARGMRGICRHRVYAFVITAHALGIHARFVQNEAHAWAEVELPGAGWLRVDLGGAATGLDPSSALDRPVYRPDVPDPLPRPPAYRESYEEARRAIERAAAERARQGRGSEDAESGVTEGTHAESRFGGGSQASPAAPSMSVGPVRGGSRAKRPLELSVDRRSFEVFRGRELEVTGVARGAGGGVSGLRIEVVLRSPRGEGERLLGVTVTGDGGRFRGVFGVPPELAVGDYHLLVRTPGNTEYAPAQAD